MSRDVVVIGGGAIGAMCAFSLAKAGARVTLLEKEIAGPGASRNSAAMLEAQLDAYRGKPFVPLASASQHMFPALRDELLEKTGIDIELEHCGILQAALDENERVSLKNEMARHLVEGWSARWLEPAEIALEFPALTHQAFGAIFYEDDGQVNAVRFLEAARQGATAAGAHVALESGEVRLTIDNGRVTGAQGRETYRADVVVVASGAWTDQIIAPLHHRLGLEPVRGQLLWYRTETRMLPAPVYTKNGAYLCPKGNDVMLAGTTTERVGFDGRVTEEGRDKIAAVARALAPDVATRPVFAATAGLRPYSPDGLPFIGPAPQPRQRDRGHRASPQRHPAGAHHGRHRGGPGAGRAAAAERRPFSSVPGSRRPRLTVNDPFGVIAFLHWNHDWNSYHFDDATRRRALRQLADIGLRSLRTDILWSDVNRGVGKFDFSAYDSWVPLLREHGIEPLILLHYNKEHTRPDGVEIWNQPPASFEEFAGYVYATVNHFRAHVSQWEIWNEPNHLVYWAAPPDGLAAYVRLLKISRTAAKAADTSCRVFNGGLTGDVVTDVGAFYARGGGPLTDALNIHTFVNPLDPQAQQGFDAVLTGTRAVMEANGDGGKPIWITEMGCPGIPDGQPRQNWFQGTPLTEAQQADWLDTQCDWVARHPEVERLFWAFYRDTGGIFKDATDFLGLVRHDFSPKPAFHRLARRIQNGK